jgi:hypothetical protein
MMMKSLLLLLLPIPALSQVNYDAGLIPDSLRKDAHTVLRDSRVSITIASPARSMIRIHEAETVLDPQGRKALFFSVKTTSFSKLEDADVYAFDAAGKPLAHIRQKDMSKAGWGEELVEDGVYTYCEVAAAAYPITVVKDYVLSYRGSDGCRDFDLDNTAESIQQAEYDLTVPKALGIRYLPHHIRVDPSVSDADKENRVYTWKVTGMKAVPEEAGAPSDRAPMIHIAPNLFELGGVTGDMSTWQSLGKWDYELNREALVLPDASQQFYKNMVREAPTDLDKARILYRYLQHNFRYVAIELGIGGWRSFPAVFTEKKKYGDCKALAWYMCACLHAVGVKSYTALVNAGELSQPVDPAFPDNEFNHVILCIPQPHDSVWLECTSAHTSFGVLSAFTENRNALLVTEDGGILVHTPRSSVDENIVATYTRVTLSDDAGGKADVTLSATGENRERVIGELYEQTHDDQKKYLVDDLEYPQPDDFSVALDQLDSPLVKARLSMAFEKVPEFTAGAKMFLRPRLYHLELNHLPDADHRTEDYVFSHPFHQTDTTCYQLPEGYAVDELPKGKVLSCPHATFVSNYWYDPGRKAVFSYASLTLKDRTIPASDYETFRRFFSDVVKEETEKIVIDKP